jgi:hypothetical protein
MPKMKRRMSKRARKIVDRAATTDVVTQLECAVRHPQATLIGALVGAVVPWFARTLAHEELPTTWSAGHRTLAAIMIVVIMGCALFSALTVYKFGRATFGDARKAVGFVFAMEGAMLVSHGTTSTVALAVLIAINALANGSAIALARDATCRRREADERRATTRARNRAARVATTATPSRAIPVIEVEVVPEVTPTTPTPRHRGRAACVPGHAMVPSPARWGLSWDVIDAEIVS